nr:hypothetical protein CFP56_73988 [Quercus suber]
MVSSLSRAICMNVGTLRKDQDGSSCATAASFDAGGSVCADELPREFESKEEETLCSSLTRPHRNAIDGSCGESSKTDFHCDWDERRVNNTDGLEYSEAHRPTGITIEDVMESALSAPLWRLGWDAMDESGTRNRAMHANGETLSTVESVVAGSVGPCKSVCERLFELSRNGVG